MRAVRRHLRELELLVSLGVILLVVLVPVYWMALTAVKPDAELYQTSTLLWTTDPTLDHFIQLLTTTVFATQIVNSIFVAVLTTAITAVVSVLAAYSLSRLRYRGRGSASAAVFFSYLLPPTLLVIPMYAVFGDLGLVNTRWALILGYLTLTVPFATWLLKGYLATIPTELEDAALVDGCTHLGAMIRVVLPLAAPGIITAGLFSFTEAWNEFLYAFIFTTDANVTTGPVGLVSLVKGDVFLWGQIMAGGLILTAPILVIYMLAQEYVVGGLTGGAIKG